MEQVSQPISDKSLWDNFLSQEDEASFDALLQRHKGKLFDIAFRVLYDRHAAEDVVQTAFVRLIQRRGELMAVESLRSWLYKTTFHLALDSKRRSRRRKGREMAVSPPAEPRQPREQAATAELREQLETALKKLKGSSRIPVVLRYLHGLSHAETGEIVNLSPDATRRRIHRALKRLRQLLKGQGLLLSLVAVEGGLRSIPTKAASADFLPFASSVIKAASTAGTATEAATTAAGVAKASLMTAVKVLVAIGLSVGTLTVVLVLTLGDRPTRRERHLRVRDQERPAHVVKRDGTPPRTPVYGNGDGEDSVSEAEKEEVLSDSISGRLMDSDGNVILNLSEQAGSKYFNLVGKDVSRRIDIRDDGSYEVDGLAEGEYSVRGGSGGNLKLRGRYYHYGDLPQNIAVGTKNADIVLVCGNPGTVRGKVLDAETRLPVTRFAVLHKYDFRSAPDRCRASYYHWGQRAGWLDYTPSVDTYRRKRDMYKERVEAMERGEEGDLYRARSSLNVFHLALEHSWLDIQSESGIFERDNYLLGQHLFTIVAEGYLPKSVEVELRDLKPVEMTFLMFREGAAVSGIVLDERGNPLQSAAVKILMPTGIEYFYSWASRPAWETVTPGTDGSGEFAFENVADGAYQIRASHAAYGAMATSRLKVVDGKQQPWDLVLRMQNGSGSVWGRVTGEEGSPLAGLSLKIRSGPYCVSCQTDGDGHYAAAALPPGDYVMTAELEKPRLGRYDREYLFSLAPSEQLRYDIAMSGLATLRGSVRTPQPAGSLEWSLRLILRSDRLTIRTDDHAAYRFKHLPPGKYELQVVSDTLENVKYTVTLAPGETRRLDINLSRHGKIEGQVIGRDGKPLADVPIAISSPGRKLSIVSDKEGRYGVRHLSPGPIQVRIPEGKFAGTWYELELKSGEVWSGPKYWGTPEPTSADKQLDIDLSGLGDVRGNVLQADGKPLGLVAMRIESAHRTVEVVTDREGKFRAEGLFPGACRVHLSWPARARVCPFELAPQEDKELEIVLPP